MKSRGLLCVMALCLLCACTGEYVEPDGSYPHPTEDTIYELVDDIELVGYSELVRSKGESPMGDVSRYSYAITDEEYYCGCVVENPDLKHVDIDTRVLLNGDMPFSCDAGGAYYWVEPYQGEVSVVPSQCTPEGYLDVVTMLDLEKNGFVTTRGDYDIMAKLNLHTSAEELKDIDLIFEIRVFDKTTRRYFRSNVFHLIVESGPEEEGYVKYYAIVEKEIK